MLSLIDTASFEKLAPAGFYLALRVGFAFPMVEVNRLPEDWVAHYTAERLMLADPVIQWVYANTGAIRWAEIARPDPRRVMEMAAEHGLIHGAAVAFHDTVGGAERSFGSFARADRPFDPGELDILHHRVADLHRRASPPTNVTEAELEALRMVRDGMRAKQMAHSLGISEGAVKQRLRNAKRKLGARTSSQAAADAQAFGLL